MAADIEWIIHENERQWSVNNCWFCKHANRVVIWSLLALRTYWQPLLAQDTVTRSLPLSDNETQQSINNLWPCIMCNLTGNWLQKSINEVIAAFRVKNNSEMLPAPSCKWASTQCQWFLVLPLGNLTGDWLPTSIYELVATIRGKNNRNTLPAPSWYSVSTEGQQFLVLHLG